MDANILDIFQQHDAFSAIALTEAVERLPYQPHMLGSIPGLFEDNPIRTTALTIEERQGKLTLIPFSERGTAGTERTTEQRKRRYFDVPRLKHEDTIYANELQNIVKFGDATVLMQLMEEVDRRLSGPTGLLASVEYTKEYMRLAAIQGLCLNPGTGTPMYNWFDEFQITQAAEVPFNLSAGTANSLRPIVNSIMRTMARKAQGAWIPNRTRMYALCGDQFYDSLVNHPDVIRTYVNWSDARDLRGTNQGAAFDAFDFAGCVWLNYRGSDDNATIKLPDDKVKFFPVGAPGVFREAMAPGESIEWINQPGKPQYVLPIPDLVRRQFWGMEVYAYPLFICTRPEMLLSGRAGT
jgi:hypothetical protein